VFRHAVPLGQVGDAWSGSGWLKLGLAMPLIEGHRVARTDENDPRLKFTPEARATSSDYSARFFPKESRERVLAYSSPDKKLVIALN